MPSLPVQLARELRKNMTPEEKILWEELRAHRFKGYKFRRQHPIIYQLIERRTFFYIADFYCAAFKLVIELDGKPHEFPDQIEYDNARDCMMREKKMKILRIKNNELKDLNGVLRKIEEKLS